MLEHIDEFRDLADRWLIAIFLDLLLALQFLLVLEELQSFANPREDGSELVVEVALLLLQRVPLLHERVVLWQRRQNLCKSQRIFLQLRLCVEDLQLFQLLLAIFGHPDQGFSWIILLNLDGKILNSLDDIGNSLQKLANLLILSQRLKGSTDAALKLGLDVLPSLNHSSHLLNSRDAIVLPGPFYNSGELILFAKPAFDDLLDLKLNSDGLVLGDELVDVLPNGRGIGGFVGGDDVDELLVGLEGAEGKQQVYLLLDV